jgi:hypothetical protein
MLSAQGASAKSSLKKNFSESNHRGGMLEYGVSTVEQEVGGGQRPKDKANEDTLIVGIQESARVVVPRDALLKKTKIQGRTLTKSKVPAMKQGMVNATTGDSDKVEAYEFTLCCV